MSTLREIWELTDRHTVYVTDGHDTWNLIGIDKEYGHLLYEDHTEAERHNADSNEWEIYKEPVGLVEYWPGIFKKKYMCPFLSEQLYEEGRFSVGDDTPIGEFIRLAKEYPPIMLEIEDE